MNVTTWQIDPGKSVGVLELGAPRDEVFRRLAEAGFPIEEDEDEPLWYYVSEMDAELTFSKGPNSVLEEVSISDERVRLGPIELIDEPMLDIVKLLKVSDDETVWTLRYEDDTAKAKGDEKAQSGDKSEGTVDHPPDAEASIKKLLTEGTLWIRTLGLGLDLVYADVLTVRVRRPADVPREGVGSLTPGQRAFAARPDLSSYLIGSTSGSTRSAGCSGTQTLLGLALMVAMGLVIWRAIDYQLRWNAATIVDGVVLETKPPPPVVFPDEFVVVYQDQENQGHRVVFKLNDFYGTPKIGDKVKIHYLPDAPDEPMGEAKVTDAAAAEFVPWGIGVMATYFILQLVIPIVGLIRSRK